MERDTHFAERAELFMAPKSRMEDILTAGNHARVSLYVSDKGEIVVNLRFSRFHKKTGCHSRVVYLQHTAAKYHSLS